MFRRLLIANRGAIARRVVRACRALGVESVVVYSNADQGAPYLTEADHAEPLPGVTAAESYLNQPAVLEIARRLGCDAVHPGYGFLAENAGFARAVREADLEFIGPSPGHLDQLGDKVAARATFAERGFPIHAGSRLVEDADDAMRAAEEIGYPVLLKPSQGGGGIGMVRVDAASGLPAAMARARAIADSSFGSTDVYLERFVTRARHVEFQVLADRQGNVMHLYERDCSVQRRHQKVIEEAPAPGIPREALTAVADAAVNTLAAVGYDGIGTVETLADADQTFGFLEVNPRIQVEHAVTEAVTGVDIVEQQIRLAAGGALPSQPELSGHAIELRLYAEAHGTGAPSTGRLTVFRPPQLHDVRVETGFAEGQFVTPFYDPLLAKIIAHGADRELAIGRALVALRAFEVRGVDTNAAVLRAVLESQAFARGAVHTRFLDELEVGS